LKVSIRRNKTGVLSAYIAKKDLEEPIVESEHPDLWNGTVRLANGWQLMLPAMDTSTVLPVTVEARRLREKEIQQ
jgi:nitrogen fixation protein NifT